ncbi:hypothetical protein OPT61_g8437 [Boeremia exigua]|uniref:Uncharacterized protein n=1 Tax=Boeremia exigua TaxID=749465 RepID=A0ACC2HYK9_9PLEO|nr:hypothetical protein OPT61_g8437 [Boeremia exigua]
MAIDASKPLLATPVKRPAEPEPSSPFAFAPEPPRKKQKSGSKASSSKVISLLPESEENFQVSIRLHSKFDVFPDALRTALEGMHRTAYVAYMDDVDTESHPSPKLTYSVITGERLSPYKESDFVFTTHKTDFKYLSMANMFLLKSFWNHNKGRLEGAEFVKLDVKDIGNPALLWLYSVRPHEVGWALDRFGCLSFCATRVVGDKLQHRVAFVECKVIKVESSG